MSAKKRKVSTADGDHEDSNIVQTPAEASELVKELLSLEENEKNLLLSELEQTDEDPLLVCKVNPQWFTIDQNNTQQAADAVLDAIATETGCSCCRSCACCCCWKRKMKRRKRKRGRCCIAWRFR
jgi:hypothetical protein